MDHEMIIAYCHACGTAMDVTALPPFTSCACPTCGMQTRVKREFGPYTLMRRHAEGGMSMVFGAHDNTLDREVAIKILNETYSADERRIAAFEREAKLTASLSHPHIVKVFTTGRAFGCFYIAMEFVSGGHLEHQIRTRGKIPEAEMLALGIEVAEGLRAAHASGLLHRDIKPGNILTDSEGHAKLVDFGLSLVTQGGKATAEEIWATPYYVPPETIEGSEEDLRSDIYAFGATLYHAIAGVPPCAETSMATEKLRHAKRNVRPLAEVDPSVSPQTAKVVEKAMAFLPENRYQSYEELIAALTRALGYATSGHHASSDRAEQRRKLLQKKRRTQQTITFAAIAIIVTGLIIILVSTANKHKPRNLGQPQTPVAGGNTQQDTTAADLAREYRNARSALQQKKYLLAADIFSRLLRHPKFQEPSRTMAGMEAILAAYLEGRGDLAGRYGRELRNHLRDQPSARGMLSPSLSETITLLGSFDPIPPPRPAANAGAQDVVASMFAGLKNWEQGLLDHAAKCFRQAASIGLSPDDQWAAFYQECARDYLHDHGLLSSPVFDSIPATRDACRKSGEQLDELLPKLKTSGRAPFNVKAWRLDISRHASLLGTRPAQLERPIHHATADPLSKIKDLIQSYRFLETTEYVKGLGSDLPGIKSGTLVMAAEAASAFLKDLEGDLGKRKVAIAVTLPSGQQANALSIAGNGHLQAHAAGGDELISWNDISADTLISLHRLLVQGGDDEAIRRHQRAIWFDWLAGNKERANQAASKIGERDFAFAKRWQDALRGLQGL